MNRVVTNTVDRLLEKQLHRWLPGYGKHLLRQASQRPVRTLRHVLFAICDHYEPLWGNATRATGEARVRAWLEGYPRLAGSFRDCTGRAPRHSFFFPGEQYTSWFMEALAELTSRGIGEVEFHLHHDKDTTPKLHAAILGYLDLFAKHGHLSRDEHGRPRYGFIHGNWCLANARSDGRWCGVDDELPLLFRTGCYADFTFPSAPDECQPGIVNQIYWPTGNLARARAYDFGEPARVGQLRRDRILMIEGPLALSLKRASWKPRIENAALTANDPPTPERIRTWIAQNIHVSGRPDWIFVKVHTHGAPEKQAASLLGPGGRTLHRELTTRYNDGVNYKLHYVTAREMFNLAAAAMDGRSGDPSHYYNYVLQPPPAAPQL